MTVASYLAHFLMQRSGRHQEYSTRTIFVSVRGVKICTKYSKVVLQVSFATQGGVLLAVEVNRIKKVIVVAILVG